MSQRRANPAARGFRQAPPTGCFRRAFLQVSEVYSWSQPQRPRAAKSTAGPRVAPSLVWEGAVSSGSERRVASFPVLAPVLKSASGSRAVALLVRESVWEGEPESRQKVLWRRGAVNISCQKNPAWEYRAAFFSSCGARPIIACWQKISSTALGEWAVISEDGIMRIFRIFVTRNEGAH